MEYYFTFPLRYRYLWISAVKCVWISHSESGINILHYIKES